MQRAAAPPGGSAASGTSERGRQESARSQRARHNTHRLSSQAAPSPLMPDPTTATRLPSPGCAHILFAGREFHVTSTRLAPRWARRSAPFHFRSLLSSVFPVRDPRVSPSHDLQPQGLDTLRLSLPYAASLPHANFRRENMVWQPTPSTKFTRNTPRARSRSKQRKLAQQTSPSWQP